MMMMMVMMHELALDLGLFPLLLNDADVLPLRTPALCHCIIVILKYHLYFIRLLLEKFGV